MVQLLQKVQLSFLVQLVRAGFFEFFEQLVTLGFPAQQVLLLLSLTGLGLPMFGVDQCQTLLLPLT